MESYDRYVVFCDWLFKFSIMFLRVINVVVGMVFSFLFITFIHTSVSFNTYEIDWFSQGLTYVKNSA